MLHTVLRCAVVTALRNRTIRFLGSRAALKYETEREIPGDTRTEGAIMRDQTINTALINDVEEITCFNCGGDMRRAGGWDICEMCGETEQASIHNHAYATAW